MATSVRLQGEVAERMQELSSDQLAHLRRLSQVDLFFLGKTVLGYGQIDAGAHGALCNFIVNEQADRRMVLMPRGFLKSTICTITDSIRLALCDPNGTRILIANEVYDNAASFLKEIKAHWDGDTLLKMLFPELVPLRKAGPGSDWSAESASINRTSAFKESTWTVLGVGGTRVSQHYTKIKSDDLIGNAAKESETVMRRTTRWTEDLVGLLDTPDCVMDFYGTRKTMSDTYSSLMERFGDRMKVFAREPIENGESIFPKISTRALMQIMTETPETWSHDYMNNPIGAGGIDWGKGLLQYYSVDVEGKFCVPDPVTGKIRKWTRSELDIIITVDPNSGKRLAPDKAAVIVHGVTPDSDVLILEARASRWSPDELIDNTWQCCLKWNPRCVGIEDAGQQNTMYYFEKRCMKERRFFRLEHLKHKNRDKELRIRTALDPLLKSKRLYALPSMLNLIGQIQLFPQLAAHNWDEIDALAHGAQLYRNGRSEADVKQEEEAEQKLLGVRGITGYGSSYVHRDLHLVR